MAAVDYLTVDQVPIRALRRIFSRIVVTQNGCWEWQGWKTRGGYGRITHQARNELVHRFMYAWLVGPIPRGLGAHVPQLDHLRCDNPPCCNPAHLALVTGRENNLRAHTPIATNARKRHCVRGHVLPERPNARRGATREKRYCQQCSRDASTARRRDPNYREYMRDYLRAYHEERNRGPMREELLRRGRLAARAYRARQSKY